LILQVKIIIGAVWVLALAVSAPQLYEYSVADKPDEDNNMTTHLSCGSHGIDESFELIYAIIIVCMLIRSVLCPCMHAVLVLIQCCCSPLVFLFGEELV